MSNLPSRHVHLDFHTSEDIPGVGKDFDKKQFQAALRLGHVNSINIFAKCHHGWSYYPTKVGVRHPTLRRNLLGEQIEACHEIGVKAPIYYTVGWSAADARAHPEWAFRRADGTAQGMGPQVLDQMAKGLIKPTDRKPEFHWTMLCPSGGYRELMLTQTQEICRQFDVDGFWYDICFSQTCHCESCLKGMKDSGVDPADEKQAFEYGKRKWLSFTDECTRIIHGKFDKATIFFNGSMSIYRPQWHDAQTQFELEDLPSSWGGYDKLPLRARYFGEKRKPLLAMSGKFHTNWGEFGGFKHPEAIRYEAAAMIAYGTHCCFGDHLHPAGQMDLQTYANIGHAYKYLERIEKFGLDGEPATRLGLFLSPLEQDDPDNQGIVNMLLESQMDFRVVMPDADLAQFDTIILTGNVRLDQALAARFQEFIGNGGKVLALADSGLDPEGTKFMIDMGVKYVGPARFEMDYLLAGKPLVKNVPATPFLNYMAGTRVKVTDGQVLSKIREPFFNRTYAHYCGHQNTPYQLKDAPHPGAVAKGIVLYLAHPLGRNYHKVGARVHRDYFINALRRIYTKPALEVTMPSAGRATLIHQPQHRRYVAHLMYAPPMQRGTCLIVEDMVPLRDVAVTVRVPQQVKKAYLVPSNQALKLKRSGKAVTVTVPEFSCHVGVVLEY